jgi:hypothetical protein
VLHAEQWLPSVKPVAWQVAATAGSTTSVWGMISIDCVSASPQAQRRVFSPASVQVASVTVIHWPNWCTCAVEPTVGTNGSVLGGVLASESSAQAEKAKQSEIKQIQSNNKRFIKRPSRLHR